LGIDALGADLWILGPKEGDHAPAESGQLEVERVSLYDGGGVGGPNDRLEFGGNGAPLLSNLGLFIRSKRNTSLAADSKKIHKTLI